MIKELTTLKQLKEFCKEKGFHYIQGKTTAFIITTSDNFFLRKWTGYGRDSVNFKILDLNTVKMAYRENIGRDGDSIREIIYKNVIAVFFYNNDTLLIFQESSDGEYYENCREFYLAKEDQNND